MNLNLRTGRPDDAEKLGQIGFEAFKAISEKHNFPPDFPSADLAIGLATMMLNRSDVYSVVAEIDGETIGSNFLWEGNQIAGVGPITVDPNAQNSTVGRALMEDVMHRSDERGFPSIRLVQAAYHNRSLSLYTKLGFDTVEPLSAMNGAMPLNLKIEGCNVRKANGNDIESCNELCRKIHGHTRTQDLADGIATGAATVVERGGRITGYASLLGVFGHAIGESNDDLKAIIGSAETIHGAGFLLPTRNGELMRWCLANGLRIVQPMTLMSRGFYQEPRGSFIPSILF